ncbi:hypothetical protein M422DRAFT_46490 [Sphaerobolus stellatus SS14]|uniref:Unplaced genomic scaffold SPHSTscaffold_35, whole genome shotgun sequence n=1 Tax=Sphaerobolus stellatus (strain SS14) TaxID=990650 RepID=A0A0C9VTM0_SPHS4|nr:hypothetical protein M422DRAFT_46490 [Sphaerobolus stellatus SS14]
MPTDKRTSMTAIVIEFLRRMRPGRLIKEDPGVKSAAWFARKPDDPFHVFANIFRLLVLIALAPIYINAAPTKAYIDEFVKKRNWFIEYSSTPDAVLSRSPAPGGGPAQYEVTHQNPQWLLRVTFDEEGNVQFVQVAWETALEDGGFSSSKQAYVTISYAMDSAFDLFIKAGLELKHPQPTGGRQYSLDDRKRIAGCLLAEYGRARRRAGEGPATEYIWLDEFCLSNANEDDEDRAAAERSYELGRLCDIFRGATKVFVFCHKQDCDHTKIDCPWGKRLFTLGEIIHATDVYVLIRRGPIENQATLIYPMGAQRFREKMQAEAEKAKRWHLYSIMQHASNSGAVTWQNAIHALVVEAILRDESEESGKFLAHKYLGKALNGLLPRRARLKDLKGEDGWEDLAWLLELNQGYFNTTGLAAVCSLAGFDVPNYRWLGKPISPKEGNERLEPIVTSFPVRIEQKDGDEHAALCFVGPQTIPLTHWLHRDAGALFHHTELTALKWGFYGSLTVVWIAGFIIFVMGEFVTGALVVYIPGIFWVIFLLLVSTMHVKREGWAYFEVHNKSEEQFRQELAQQDPFFKEKLLMWGDRQLSPQWERPNRDNNGLFRKGILVDLKNRLAMSVEVLEKPDQLVAMAVHGTGITCMLLDREKDHTIIAKKIGMANLPCYILAQTVRSGTIYVGGSPPECGSDIKLSSINTESAHIGEPIEGNDSEVVEDKIEASSPLMLKTPGSSKSLNSRSTQSYFHTEHVVPSLPNV